jgi:two-component system, cell cycle sensor histidine kinase and response regulator CckA
MSAEGPARQQVVDALSNSEVRFQTIFAQAAVGIAQISLDKTWLLVNKRFCQMLGYSEAELRKKTLREITHPDHIDESQAGRRQLLAGEISTHTMEKRYIRKDGTVFWGRLNRSLVRDHDNLPQYVIAVLEDITDRKDAECALRDSEQRLILAQNAAHLGVCEWNLSTNAFRQSEEYARLYGLAPDHPALTLEELSQRIHPEDRELVQANVKTALERTHAWDAEYRVVWPDGSIHWLHSKGAVLLDASGQPVRSTGVVQDITEGKRAEAVLRESEERFRNMADTAPVLIWVSGPDKGCIFFNKGWLDFTGRTMQQELGNGWADSVHPDDLDRCWEIYSSSFDARRCFVMEYRLRRADGDYRWVLDNGIPRREPGGVFAGYIGSCVDITDLRRAQEQALARQKLESIGVLAGGIAHDFNNLLAGVLAEAELAATELEQGDSPLEGLQRIRLAAGRGAEIVRELMIYSGQDKADPVEPVDLSRLVEEMLELLKVSISKHTILKTNLPRNLPAVLGRASQIRQIVMNLIMNASEALGDNGGVIRVRALRAVVPSEPGPNSPANLPPGDYLNLEVSDTGVGMTQEVQAKIFDPFFSTKFAGRGLGLAVVQGIVRDHGGAINLVSAPGQGATFEIFLPCANETAQLQRDGLAASRKQQGPREGTVLLVEDEGVLRVAVSRMLQKNGFEVIEAGDGSSALDLVRTYRDKIDVMLLDITLPGVSSREVFEQARRLRPNLKVILTSAYGREAVDASFEGLRVERFIRKPFQFVDLMGVLQDALSA